MLIPSWPNKGPTIVPRPYPLPAAELPLPDAGGALWLSAATLFATASWTSHALPELRRV